MSCYSFQNKKGHFFWQKKKVMLLEKYIELIFQIKLIWDLRRFFSLADGSKAGI